MGKEKDGMLDWMKGSDALNIVVMGRHIKQDEDGNDVYVCDSCGAEFSSSSDLVDHMPSHDAEIQEVIQEVTPMITEEYSPEVVQDWNTTMEDPYTYQEAVVEAAQNAGMSNEELTNQLESDAVAQDEIINEGYSTNYGVDISQEEYSPEAVQSWNQGLNVEEQIPEEGWEESGYSSVQPFEESVEVNNFPDDSSKKEESKEDPEAPLYKIRFSDGEKVLSDYTIYSVIMPPGDLEKAQKTGLVQLAIYGDGGKIAGRTALADMDLTPQNDVDSAKWNEVWTAQTGITQKTETETETEKEETFPEDTVIKPVLIYFEAYQGDNVIFSAVSGSPFVVKWKVQNVYRTVLQCPDNSEREGNEGQTAQLMENNNMSYSLLSFDDKDNSVGSWSIMIDNISDKTENVVADLSLTSNGEQIHYSIQNANPGEEFYLTRQIGNGVEQPVATIKDRKEGEVDR